MTHKSKAQRRPDRLSTYFYQERGVLASRFPVFFTTSD